MSTLRIKPKQKEEVRKKAIEINKLLIKKGMEPLKDSELIHAVIDEGIKIVMVTEDGRVKLDCS